MKIVETTGFIKSLRVAPAVADFFLLVAQDPDVVEAVVVEDVFDL